MRGGTAPGRHEMTLAVLKVQTMGEYGALAEQAEMVVDVQVALAPRELPGDGLDLIMILRQVRMNPDIGVLGCESPGCIELRLRRRERESRCDRVAQPPVAMPAFDQRSTVGISGLMLSISTSCS